MKCIKKNIIIFLSLILILTTIMNSFDASFVYATPESDGWELIAEHYDRSNNTYFDINNGDVISRWGIGYTTFINNFYYGTIDLLNYEYMYDGTIFRSYGSDGQGKIKGSSSGTVGDKGVTKLYRRPTTLPKYDLSYKFENGLWTENSNGSSYGIYMPTDYGRRSPSYMTFRADGGSKRIHILGNLSLNYVVSLNGHKMIVNLKYYDKDNVLLKTTNTDIPIKDGPGQTTLFNVDTSVYYSDVKGAVRASVEVSYRNDYGQSLYYCTRSGSYGDYNNNKGQNIYVGSMLLNNIPELTILKPVNNLTVANEPELSSFTVEGYARDIDNDNLTVTAEVAGVSKSINLSNTSIAKPFSIPFDVIQDEIRQGTHKVVVTVNDGSVEVKKEVNIIVTNRVKHGSYVLVNEPVFYRTIYEDPESDSKYQEQYKFIHDPNLFQNSMGSMADSGTWRTTTYSRFEKVGLFQGVHRAKDNPKANNAFDEFRKWSRESLGMIEFKVHRVPIPRFTLRVNQGAGNSTVSISDYSYDLDHQSKANKGISARQWQWKVAGSSSWTNGKPSTIANGNDYIVRLKVRDIDGENGLGVWSDWLEQSLTTKGIDLPPVAQFIVTPQRVSHNPSKTISISDLSYSPKGYSISQREWIIRRKNNNQLIYSGGTTPTSAQLKSGGLGLYTASLRVRDNIGVWSNTHIEEYEVINYPPQAKFTTPEEVYRDTVIKPVNSSTDADGDNITYQWHINLDGVDYFIGNQKEPNFTIQQIINNNNIKPIKAISDNWMIKLKATDTLGAFSTTTEALKVVNNKPIGVINGKTSVAQHTNNQYTSGSYDNDSADNPLSVYRWKQIKPDGNIELWNTKDVIASFDIVGKHTVEHWVIDQIGDISDVVNVDVNVVENKAPNMTITSPNGTLDKPSIIPTDPLMKWKYTDSEDDPQEKYSFDFYYADDDTLVRSPSREDSTGNIREYQMPVNSFERFRKIKAVGRSYSKFKWSELSNIVYFIINDAPTGGFNLNKNPADYIRDEEIKVSGFGDDPNIENGDSISYKYYLKKLPGGNETLISTEKDFTYNINTLTPNQGRDTYQIRQVITDSLGSTAQEVIKNFTINNQKPIVNITEPSSSNSSNPTLISEIDLMPTIKWDYSDLDKDKQKKYRVTIFDGNTNNIVTSSREVTSENKSWKSSKQLIEDKLYSVIVEVYDGYEWGISSKKYFKVYSLRITGYLAPNPAMAGDQILFFISTEGYADKIEIVVPSDLIAMDKRVSMGYPGVTYPSIFFDVDKTVLKKEDILKYIVWVSTEDTLGKNNNRLRSPYKFIVRAYKGSVTREIELELDIKGSILELLKPGIKNKIGK